MDREFGILWTWMDKLMNSRACTRMICDNCASVLAHSWPWGYRKSISTILEHYIHMYIYILKNLFLKFLEKYLIIGYRSYVEDKKWCLPNNGQKRGTGIKFGNGLIGRRNESTDIDQILSVYSSRIVDPESCEPDKKYLPRYRRSLSRWQELDLIGLAGQMTCNKS